MRKPKYNDELLNWIRDNYKGSTKEVIAKINATFGVKLTKFQLHGIISRNRSKLEIPTIPTNAGRKPFPIGYIGSKCGVKYIVLSNGIKYNYNRYLYEEAFGKQPKDYIMMYLDGNQDNNNLSNMFMLSRRNSVFIRANRLKWKTKDDLSLYCLMSDLASETPHYRRKKRGTS